MTGLNFLSDANSLVGNELPVEIPQWLIKTFVPHILAFFFALISTILVPLELYRFYRYRDSEKIELKFFRWVDASFAAAFICSLVALALDLWFFETAKHKIESIGSVHIGNAFWINVAAFICFLTRIYIAFENHKSNKKNQDPSN